MIKQTREITHTPFALQQYVRTLLPRKSDKGSKLPNLVLRKENVSIDKEKVLKYASVCGFKKSEMFIPALYPHILAFPLHLELLLDKAFPFKIIGMVHINNTVTIYKPIPYDAKLTLEVYFDEMTDHVKGKVIPIITKVYHYGELVYESRSENLKMTKSSTEPKEKKNPEPPILGEQEQWTLDTFAGLRYAFIGGAGDFNPIHLFPWTAKAFGFKRHIIHGMWTKARVLAALSETINKRPFKIHVDFKLPVFLPSKINFNYKTEEDSIQFEVRDQSNEKPHLKGNLKFL